MTAAATTPADTIRSFSALIEVRDLDALVGLYEPDAAFVPEPGSSVTGRNSIREALGPFLALRPRMTGRIEQVVQAGTTALVTNRWALSGEGPDGSPVELSGVSADVLRRRDDGTWGIVIDDPWGGGA